VFPGDEGAQEGLLRLIGLCLTDETKYQKAFMFVGPKRGGRGTIGRLLKGLVRRENYVSPTLRVFSEPFGMEGFIGRKVAVFADASLDGLGLKELSVIGDRIKSITGEDDMHVNRKNLKYWNGSLRTRILIFSNQLLRFQDDSGALAGRFVSWRMKQSFAGREDLELTQKLLAERSGIFNLALDALDRLRAEGVFVQHQSGREMAESLEDLTSDIVPFARECCEVGPEYSAFLLALFDLWNGWCLRRGIKHGWGPPQFSEKLRAQFPNITSSRPRIDGRRVTELYGIGRKK
jgi:putative DNA primase/helicase